MIVVKFGGHAMTDKDGAFALAIKSAISQGIRVVVVHGGGPQIDKALQSAGIQSKFLGGFRVTTPEVFAIVERVLSIEVGPHVAASLTAHGIPSQAISGREFGILIAQALTELVDGSPADLGLVGVVTKVNTAEIDSIIESGVVPVISPIASDSDGVVGYNVNADLAAAAIAGALDAESLIVMTDVEGIYRSWPDKTSLIAEISASELSHIKSTFEEGMAPKVQATLDAISAGAKAVRIINGTDPLAFGNALANKGGTLVVA